MKLKKILAAVAAAAVAVSMVAVNVFAAQSEAINTLTLNSADEDGKLIQWPINALTGVDAVNTVTLKGVASLGDGWCGGGGQFGFESVDGWKQSDFALDGANVTLDAATGEFTAEITFAGEAPAVDPGTGIIQVGWWWGSGDGTMQLTDITVNGTTIIGLSGTFVEAAPETEAPAEEATEETEAPAEEAPAETEAPAEEPAEETEAPAAEAEPAPEADAETAPVATGNVAVASIAAVMALAGAAAVVSKKRN